MAKEVDSTYYCDLSGKEIDDVWQMVRIELDYGNWQITPRGMNGGETIHVHPDEHDIERGNDEAGEWDITAYITRDKQVAMFEWDAGMRSQYVDPSHDEPFGDLADRIEAEALRDE
ncbi:hypothetical protein OSG_eHP28_00045 [environmental Halophage eHP-28]|nr:hypothetical protein OSG_eHP28_00045 [environmental Halophage eHP-28]